MVMMFPPRLWSWLRGGRGWVLCFVFLLNACALPRPQRRAPAPAPLALADGAVLYAGALATSSPFQRLLRQTDADLSRGAPPAACNWLKIIESGEDAMLARIHLIRSAKRSIELQTFIWTDDEIGRLMADELIAAAKRGVQVRVLVDYVGLAKDARSVAYVTQSHPNLQLAVYRPTASTLERSHLASLAYALTNFKGANQRMHHKVFVVDQAVGITGGRNVENTYYNQSLSMNFKDRDALVVGPAARQMVNVFEAFWAYRHTMPAEQMRDVASAVAARKQEGDAGRSSDRAGARRLRRLVPLADDPNLVDRLFVRPARRAKSVEFISDVPGKNGEISLTGSGRSTRHLLQAMRSAEKELWIQSPYLVLGRSGMRFFKKLRREKPGLAIAISTNSFGSTDNLLAYAGNMRERDHFVQQFGFNVYEYRPHPNDLERVLPNYAVLRNEARRSQQKAPFLCLHAKSFVVDDHLAFIGSYNLDPRSAHLNTEAGLLIDDPAIAGLLKKEIQRDCSDGNSWVIALRETLPGLSEMSFLSRSISDLSPLDISPINATIAFELKPGKKPVPPSDPRFYERFRPVGEFPGTGGLFSEKELLTRLFKFLTKPATPLL